MSSDTPAQTPALRAGRRPLTASTRRAMAAANPAPTRGRGRVVHTAGVDVASSSQTGQSQVIDPTQYQHVGAQLHRLEHEEYGQPQVEEEEEEVQVEADGEDHPGFPGGPSNLELLGHFDSHRAYKVWTDPSVSKIQFFFQC